MTKNVGTNCMHNITRHTYPAFATGLNEKQGDGGKFSTTKKWLFRVVLHTTGVQTSAGPAINNKAHLMSKPCVAACDRSTFLCTKKRSRAHVWTVPYNKCHSTNVSR